jgi:hypothetical protein
MTKNQEIFLDEKTNINSNRWLENIDICVKETANILQAGKVWLQQ